jgi:hypothetical protein
VEERGGGEDGGVHWWTRVLAQLTRVFGRRTGLRCGLGWITQASWRGLWRVCAGLE